MPYLSRRVDFSAAHVYHVPQWSEEENRRVFGKCNYPHGHGHDYKLEVMVRGILNKASGIVVNTTDIKNIVGAFVNEELDGRFLNHEHPYFREHIPTTENLVCYIWDVLQTRFTDCDLFRIRVHENHYLSAEKEVGSLMKLTRKYHFCAAHRLHSEHLTAEQNRELFGKCNNPHGHGHNYFLDVTVQGVPDAVTGMIMNLADLDEIVEKVILDKVDHKHLNLDMDEFKNLNPTSEVVAMVFYRMLKPHLPRLNKIGIWETEKNYFEYMEQETQYA